MSDCANERAYDSLCHHRPVRHWECLLLCPSFLRQEQPATKFEEWPECRGSRNLGSHSLLNIPATFYDQEAKVR